MHKLILLISLIAAPISSQPNVVIILTDDLGWGDVSYHGGKIPTPNIDRLVSKGLEMNRFYSEPSCSPTRASMLTGINSFANGVVRPFANPRVEAFGMPLEHKIMPEYFKEAGYQTALSGKWHLGMHEDAYLPGNRGFESTYGHLMGGIDYFDHSFSGRLDWHRDGKPLREDGYSTTLIADEAINIIKSKNADKPLFLYVAFNAPHTPIQAENNDIELFADIADEYERKYAANIFSLDREIGKIIKGIQDAGIIDETIILFFSDNGPVFDIDPIAKVIAPDLMSARGSSGDLKGSKLSAHEGGIRVPAVIYWKGVLEGSKSEQFFFAQDILPTLLSASSINYDNNKFTGVDRWKNLVNGDVKQPINVHTGNIVIQDSRALFDGKWKLFYSQNMQTLGSKTYELYDILNDPLETENLSSKYPDIFNDMKETIDSQTLWMNPPLINPPMMYLWGDRFHTEDRFLGNPWLDRNYELKTPPNKIVSALIFIWILIQAKKNLFLGILLALITMTIIYKKRKTFKSS
jgi:arylsulfatase A-like enzyme